MTNGKQKFILMAVVILLSILTLGCGRGGTDSGNPGWLPLAGEVRGNGDFIGYRVCSRLKACYGISASSCDNPILTTSGMTSGLNLNTATYPNLSSAITGIANSNLFLDFDNLESCHIAIDTLSCNDPLVVNAYNSLQPTNFSQAYRILDASPACQNSIAP